MKMANFDGMKFDRNSKIPCTTTETITFDYQEQNWVRNGSDWFHITIAFPDRFEEIVMVRAVDIHSAVGNAGGYIGLFLGNKY